MKRKRVAVKPLALMSWCSMDAHAGWAGEHFMLCPGGKPPEKLTCECPCHEDPQMQEEALEMAREFKAEIDKTRADNKPKRKRIKKRVR